MNRHPLSHQTEPPQDGLYEIQEFPGDKWRPVRWSHGAFREGLMVRPWWRWREVAHD